MKNVRVAMLLTVMMISIPMQAISPKVILAAKGTLKIGLAMPLIAVACIQGIYTYAACTSPYSMAKLDDILYKIAAAEGAIAPGAVYLFYRGVKDIKGAITMQHENENHNKEKLSKKKCV